MKPKTIELTRERAFPKGDNTTDKQFETVLRKTSKKNKDYYVTFHVHMFTVEFYLYKRKPQSLSTYGAEDSYRLCGGFYKNGKVVKPSNSFIAKFNHCPVSR